MEDLLDAVRRIISRWVETTSPIEADLDVGDTVVTVASTARFQAGDEVMIEAPTEGEPNLVIQEIISDTQVRLASGVSNQWVTSESPVLRKLINGMYVQGIYIGDPEVIPQYPAITVSGPTIESTPLTLDSWQEHFEVEITVYVEEATHEDGYRFMLQMLKTMREGLKKNIYPLVNDYNSTAITADIAIGDEYIRVADSSIFHTVFTDKLIEEGETYPLRSDVRIILEDRWKSEESRVREITEDGIIRIVPNACNTYLVSNSAIAIQPMRFIFNSWPKTTNIGKVVKGGTLLQAATINWFADEEDVRYFKNNDPSIK